MNSDNYYNLYLTQFFTTLGQLSAVLLSTTLAVPMYSFYVAKRRGYQNIQSDLETDDVVSNSSENENEDDQDENEDINNNVIPIKVRVTRVDTEKKE